MGLLGQSVDANGDVTNYTYSSNNFLTSETQIVGTSHLTTTYTNNAYGEPLTATDPAGNTTYYSYDQYGDPTTATDSLGHTHTPISISTPQTRTILTTGICCR